MDEENDDENENHGEENNDNAENEGQGDDLSGAVSRFLDAEKAIQDLIDSCEELDVAAKTYQEGTETFEGTRNQLDEASKALVKTSTGFVEAATEARKVLQRLEEIDPAQFARDLSELRRDISSQAADLRESSRTLSRAREEAKDGFKRVEKTIGSLSERVDGSSKKIETLTKSIESLKRGTMETGEKIETLTEAQNVSSVFLQKRIKFLTAITAITLLVVLVITIIA